MRIEERGAEELVPGLGVEDVGRFEGVDGGSRSEGEVRVKEVVAGRGINLEMKGEEIEEVS